ISRAARAAGPDHDDGHARRLGSAAARRPHRGAGRRACAGRRPAGRAAGGPRRSARALADGNAAPPGRAGAGDGGAWRLMDARLAAAWAQLPGYLSQHVLVSASALLLGVAISLPLAVAASRSAAVRWPSLLVASLVQTIPSLALLALFYPLLLALSMLPILRNGYAGIAGVDPAIVEAARGMGMTDRQRLMQVELPLAAPVIMAGVRTAAVWTIGAATLATSVGQTSLGNYIFSGLQTENWVFVLFGCAASAALALAADQLLGLIEHGLATRSRWRVAA